MRERHTTTERAATLLVLAMLLVSCSTVAAIIIADADKAIARQLHQATTH